MSTGFWSDAHGAATHFPIALALISGAFDIGALLIGEKPVGRGLNMAGYWTIVSAAVLSLPAVLSGLLITKGSLLGHGALRLHHLFVWPAFALLIGLATWRVFIGVSGERKCSWAYLSAVVVLIGLISAAGYWGGRMMTANA